MSERGLPVVDGAPACPFVAFDDDRDGRSTAPDHRHRCFAEPTPAPRALAHQDAYCLSPAFAVCPAFQDWARREAAAARFSQAAAPAPRPSRGAPPAAVPATLFDDEPDAAYDDEPEDAADDGPGQVPDHDPYDSPAADREDWADPAEPIAQAPSRRSPQREWAAPPPWMDADAESDEVAPPPASAAPGAIPGWGVAAAGAAGAAAVASGGGRPHTNADKWGGAARGLAGSAADRLAGPDPDAPPPARPQRSYAPPPVDDPDDDAWPPAAVSPTPARRSGGAVPPRSSSSGSRAQSGSRRPPERRPAPRDGARPQTPPREASELFGPAWEQPRRYEAYPSLRTRVGLPSFAGLPRVGVAAIAIVAAAMILFFVGPMILGLGSKSPGTATATPSPIVSASPTGVATATPPPAPTSQTYTVVSGDTLTKIAAKFHVTLKALRAANPSIKNVNAIAIGDILTIPAPASSSAGGAVGGASPSPS